MQTRAGAIKIAAQRVGISEKNYRERIAIGQKWCFGCRDWHPLERFTVDKTRGDGLKAKCRDFVRRKQAAAYQPTPRPRPGRRFIDARSNDKKQARRRVNHLIDVGLLPRPSTVPCTDCQHHGGGHRHEYDHFLGYAPEHHEHVQVVCTPCHAARTRKRGENQGCRRVNP